MREGAHTIMLEPISVVETRAKGKDVGADLFLLRAQREFHAILMRSTGVISTRPCGRGSRPTNDTLPWGEERFPARAAQVTKK